MAVLSGRRAREAGDFRCERCHEQVHLAPGNVVPTCPACGNDRFEVRYHAADNSHAAPAGAEG